MAEATHLGEFPALLDRPEGKPVSPAVLLTHGAGGGITDPGLEALGSGLSDLGHLVVRFDLPYRAAGRKSPPKAESSVPGFREAFEAARELAPELAWVAGGKSYGGRVASVAVAKGMEAAGLLFYGYPLHPPGRPESLRVDHWPEIKVPCLFVQGTNDPLCELTALKSHLPELPAAATLEVVEGGDHSLKVSASRSPDGRRKTAGQSLTELVPAVAKWLSGLA